MPTTEIHSICLLAFTLIAQWSDVDPADFDYSESDYENDMAYVFSENYSDDTVYDYDDEGGDDHAVGEMTVIDEDGEDEEECLL